MYLYLNNNQILLYKYIKIYNFDKFYIYIFCGFVVIFYIFETVENNGCVNY
jgi:hypothetical protein